MSEIENITDNDLDTAEYIDLEDENGDTVTFELIGRIEVDGQALLLRVNIGLSRTITQAHTPLGGTNTVH